MNLASHRYLPGNPMKLEQLRSAIHGRHFVRRLLESSATLRTVENVWPRAAPTIIAQMIFDKIIKFSGLQQRSRWKNPFDKSCPLMETKSAVLSLQRHFHVQQVCSRQQLVIADSSPQEQRMF
ncbi:MAG: hypothetical protein NZ553_00035 [Caldilinea sp.]|nr:hypothetical protein [Caldilinea sp.]MDW8438835.1 hypothetical protein [Caldilineaceae bacterium]